MRAEIIAVGTEILLGQIVNTNARVISEALATAGIDVWFHTVVGDNQSRIAESITTAATRADFVILTGGLGPTHDDLTREAIAEATGRPLERRSELEQALKQRFAALGRPMAEANLRQAELPRGAEALPNPRGSAPGIYLAHNRASIFALPGVPYEMEGMLSESVLARISSRTGGSVLVSRVLKVAGVPESDLAQSLQPIVARLDRERTATVALLPSFGEVSIRITSKGRERDQALESIAPVENQVRAVLGASVFGADGDTLASVVNALMTERGLTLALAESVTGGMVASQLVSVPGASKFLKAGFIAYSVESKMRDLNVSKEIIDSDGPVSERTAEAMAMGARLRASCDLGLATTGEAGPDSSGAKLGSVVLALAWDAGTATRSFVAPGDREVVRRWASMGALNLLRLWLIGEIR